MVEVAKNDCLSWGLDGMYAAEAPPIPRSRLELSKLVGGIGLRKILATGLVTAASLSYTLSPRLQEAGDLALSWGESDAVLIAKDLTGNQPNVNMPTASMDQAVDYLNNAYGMSNGLFKESELGLPSSVWWNTVAANALMDVELTGGKTSAGAKNQIDALVPAMNAYWNGHGYYPDVAMFHNQSYGMLDDDNAWIGLLQMRWQGPGYLERSKQIFKLEMSQWDESAGGIYWKVQDEGATNHDRAIVSNATVAQLGVQLYLATGDKNYLEQAEKIYAWTRVSLYDKPSGLYNDHVDGNQINRRKWTYVQGEMVTAGTALHLANPLRYSLDEPLKLAERSMDHFKYCDYFGEPAFRAAYFRSLLFLSAIIKREQPNKLPGFMAGVDRTMKNAIANLPNQPSTLVHTAGSVAVLALSQLPANRYIDLYPLLKTKSR